MKKSFWGAAALAGAAVFAFTGTASSQTVFTQWNFNQAGLDADHPATSTGTGTASHIGGTTNTAAISGGAFPSQSGSGDPNAGVSWSSVGYPLQGVGDRTAGFEFDVSTVNQADIVFSYAGRVSGGNSRYTVIQYSTNGGTSWIDNPAGLNTMANANFSTGLTLNLTGVTAANNNPNFRVRVVTVFSPNAFTVTTPPGSFPANADYQPASCPTGTCATDYIPTGAGACTFRVDVVTFSGTPQVSTPPAGLGSSSPVAGCPGDSTTLMVAVSPGANPTSLSYTVTANLTSIGGAANQAFNDLGADGDVDPGDGVYSFQLIGATGTAGAHTVTATVTDDQSRSSNAPIHYGIGNCSNDATPTVVISQVYGGGGGAGALWDGDFVELYNRTSAAVTLDGWSVQYASSGGSTNAGQVRSLTGSIAGHGYYLARMSNQTPGDPMPAVDAGSGIALGGGIFMAADSGKVFLANVTTPVACSDVSVMDSVGYGPSASCFEGAGPTRPALTAGTAAFRKNGGCQDSNENFNDFERLSANPRNSASPLNTCGSTPPTGKCCFIDTVNGFPYCDIMTETDCTNGGGTWTNGGTCLDYTSCDPFCGSADFNCDGDTGTDSDIELFFRVLAGEVPPLPCISNGDFNGDGDFGTDSDIEAFFRVLAGGTC